MPCSWCELSQTCRTSGLRGAGSENPDILFIGGDPNKNEDRLAQSGVGETWDTIKGILEELKMDVDKCRFTHSVRCHVPETKSIGPKNLAACYPHLVEEVLSVNPKVIVFLGADAVKGGLKSREKLTSLRGGRPMKATFSASGEGNEDREFDAFVTYSPGQAFRQPSLFTDIVADIAAVRDFLSGDLRADNLLTLPVVNEDDLAHLTEHLETERPKVAFDLETTSTYRFREGSRVLCLGLCFDPDFAYVIPYDYGRPGDGEDWGLEAVEAWKALSKPYIERILGNPNIYKFGHNVSFDATYPETTMGIKVRGVVGDTMLEHYCVNERVGTHGLEHLASLVGHAGYDAAIGPYYPDKMHLAPWEELYTYNGADCIVTWKLDDLLLPQITKDKNLRRVYQNLLLKGLDHLPDLTRNGVFIHQGTLDEVKLQLDADILTMRDAIQELSCVQTFPHTYIPLSEKEKRDRMIARGEDPDAKPVKKPRGAKKKSSRALLVEESNG